MRIAAAVLCILLAGCALQDMDPDSEVSVGNGIRVTPQPGFAQVHLATIRYWTKNGTGLDELGFYTGIKNGEPLFPVSGKSKKDLPLFQARMTPNDVEDLIVAALTAKGMQTVHAASLRPCPFGAAAGFCFDLSLANDEGLGLRGKALARLQNGMLDVVLFTAPADFYFDQVGPAVDRILASIRTQ